MPDVRARAEARRGLYVHVPFCLTRCSYCDFSTGSLSAAAVERYLSAAEREAELVGPSVAAWRFSSVFFGGGTPSALCARHFRRLVAALRRCFRIEPAAEISLEANPETVRDELLEAWAEAGVNRLSFGVQSFVPEELQRLGRLHGAERPAEALARARSHGFRRLSLDLMFGYPGHGAATWTRTLRRALELAPEHLSAYCYIPEPGTPLGDAIARGETSLPSEDEQAECYATLETSLADHGYRCYETSNFCRPDGAARHNLVYWLRRPYVGLGPSAHGLVDGLRYGNHYGLARWAAALEAGALPRAEEEAETDETRAREIVMLGLRLACGVHEDDHAPEAWRGVRRRYGVAFERALATSRLERCPGGVRIPARHRFLADDVIAWIDAEADRTAFDRPAQRSLTFAA